MQKNIPIITVDGPTASGKGTLSLKLAKALEWNYLDSGAFYRLLALFVIEHWSGENLPEEVDLLEMCGALSKSLKIKKISGEIRFFMEGRDVTCRMREEDCSAMASKVSVFGLVRKRLMTVCKPFFLQPPGLVTDGRDMGTVIFPEAELKLFLEADPEVRAQWRYIQLKELGINGNLPDILKRLKIRDESDSQRACAPLKPAEDSVKIDVTSMTEDQVFEFALKLCQEKGFI